MRGSVKSLTLEERGGEGSRRVSGVSRLCGQCVKRGSPESLLGGSALEFIPVSHRPQVLVAELHRRALVEYVRPLLRGRLRCRSARSRSRVAGRLREDAAQLQRLFRRLVSARLGWAGQTRARGERGRGLGWAELSGVRVRLASKVELGRFLERDRPQKLGSW